MHKNGNSWLKLCLLLFLLYIAGENQFYFNSITNLFHFIVSVFLSCAVERMNICFECRTDRPMKSQRRTRTSLASPCRSCGTSCRRRMNSKLRCSCCRRSWHTIKGTTSFTGIKFDLARIQKLTLTSSLSFSDELNTEENTGSIVSSPSPPPSLPVADQRESGIRRL